MKRDAALLLALLGGLAGYFGPWTWHPAVAFRYSADDLAEFVRFMPAVRTGQVLITRELFYMPVWLASIGLALWFGRRIRSRVARAVVGAPVVYAAVWPMPMYPFILDAYRSPDFSLAFWASASAAVVCAAALAAGTRLSARAAGWIWAGAGLLGATVAPLHFVRLKPALDAQHGWTLGVGWGVALAVAAFLAVAAVGGWQVIDAARSSKSKTA